MDMTLQMQQFIADHLLDDTARLLFAAHRYPDVDVPFAVEQIEARRRLRNKLPEWYSNLELIMGGRIPAEQCSSESTARYKRKLLEDYHSLCDMTGGMGVDFWYMSRGLDLAIYTECQHHLCEAARHNFARLSSSDDTRIVIREGISTQLPIPDVDVIYLDPARRSDAGSRIYEIEDCMPDVIGWQNELLSHCRRLITKVSPMADITRTLSRLHHVVELHIVSVKNECKELLIVQQPEYEEITTGIMVHCVDFLTERTIRFSFGIPDSSSSSIPILEDLQTGQYLYEPDVSVMKAQAFAQIAEQYSVRMLDANTHLFISDQQIVDFPGRSFIIDQVIPFSSRELKRLRKLVPQANLSTRNFPLSSDQLRMRTGIRDGGTIYLFGCQSACAGHVLLLCHKF